MVTEMLVGVDGAILESSVYPAVVQNLGDRVEVELRSVDPYRGFIDFQLI
jgi:hypothetical protein